MIVKVCEVEWKLNKKMAVPLPQSSVVCVENGTLDQVRLILLATAKLRLGEIPFIEIKNQALLFYFILILF